MSNSKVESKDAIFNIESCDTILQVAKELYQDELDRYKQIENKTAITLAFIGIVITLLIGNLESNRTLLINIKINTIFWGVDLLILLGFIISVISLLNSITVSNLQQVSIDTIVNIEDATSSPAQVKINIAATYQNIVNHNLHVINKKVKKYEHGITFTKYSFTLFSISFLLQGVIQYVST